MVRYHGGIGSERGSTSGVEARELPDEPDEPDAPDAKSYPARPCKRWKSVGYVECDVLFVVFRWRTAILTYFNSGKANLSPNIGA